MPRGDVGRNDPCPCGSGAKYKHCCLRDEKSDQSASRREPWRRELEQKVERIREAHEGMGWEQEHRAAVEALWEACELLAEHLPAEVTSLDAAEDQLDRSVTPIAPWIQQGIDSWIEAAEDHPEAARQGAVFVGDLLERFPDESRNDRRGLEADQGQLLARAGEWEEAESIFDDLIEERPDSPDGYGEFADALLAKEPPEPERAVEVLERALERPVDNPAAWDLEMRLEDAKKEMRWSD